MDFYDIVAQVTALLQREGRASYRALKRQFRLADDYIEDLKEELIYAKRLAVDEGGRVLVWTGDPGLPPVSASPPPPSTPPSERQEAHMAAAESRAAAPLSTTAERRQLTVMFCDLVDSTRLAGQLDPEDLRDVVQAYQAVCAEAVRRFGGHIAQYLGDGLLIYFGYPIVHEDDAPRAVHTALAILEAMQQLNSRLDCERRVRLAVRLGIHTGLVVVGNMGGGDRQEQLALGWGDAQCCGAPPESGSARYGGHQCGDTAARAGLVHLSRPGHTHPQRGAPAHSGVSGARGQCGAEPFRGYRHDRLNPPGGARRGGGAVAAALGAGGRRAWAGGGAERRGGHWQIAPGPGVAPVERAYRRSQIDLSLLALCAAERPLSRD